MAPPLAHAQEASTTPNQLIGTAQGFLEWSVEDYLQRSAIQARHEISINPIDPRLRLAYCDQGLDAALESPAEPIGRVTVRISCTGSSPWTIFVPGQVKFFREVVVITQPLKRLAVIGAEHVALAERDIGLIKQGYLTSVDQVVGKKLTRPTVMDQVLSPSFLNEAELIRRGDQVVISARTGGINVRMPGEALADGSQGQQIRVRNQRSERVVRARVVGPGQVEVDM
jgi:flagella basal body P-ring formation protein FlgA